MAEEKRNSELINSIIRATDILELYGKLDVKYLGIADISNALNLHKTTTFRIVKTLEHQGWLVQDIPNGKYKLGTKLTVLASNLKQYYSADELIRQEMKKLRDEFNEDVVLTMMIDNMAICIEKMQSKNALQISSSVGRSISMVKGTTGRVLLANLPQGKQNDILDLYFGSAPEELAARKNAEEELEAIKKAGYASTSSDLDEGVMSICVPVFNEEGRIKYSLALLGEENRMRAKDFDKMLGALRRAATMIEKVSV